MQQIIPQIEIAELPNVHLAPNDHLVAPDGSYEGAICLGGLTRPEWRALLRAQEASQAAEAYGAFIRTVRGD